MRPAWAEVSLRNLRQTFRNIQQHVGREVVVCAVVKGDATGHGAIDCAQALQEEGARWFAVGSTEEGVRLRDAGITGRTNSSSTCAISWLRGLSLRAAFSRGGRSTPCGLLSSTGRWVGLGSKVGSNKKAVFSPKRGLSCARSTKVLMAHNPKVSDSNPKTHRRVTLDSRKFGRHVQGCAVKCAVRSEPEVKPKRA